MCYVCGSKNPSGFKLRFEHPEKGLLKTHVTFAKEHQGFKGIVHGGLMATILDEMMVSLAWKEGLPAVTAELTVRFKKAAKIGQKILFEGRIERGEGRAIYAHSEAKDEQGELLAHAQCHLHPYPPKTFKWLKKRPIRARLTEY